MATSQFNIYNASAGSGKTFTLVKEYLKILIKSHYKEPYKNVLAITFTNKAVEEMKERILEALKQFSSETILKSPNSMFKDICEELGIDGKTLHKKSKAILNSIVHNYAAFNVFTIDGFTHQIIRTFAYDLRLPLNFEVELDVESLLYEAVDSLIAKAGTDKALTKVLVDFAIEKADDDKSWDVSLDFNKVSKLLVSENDIPFIKTLSGKTLDDFNALKTYLRERLKALEKTIVNQSQNILAFIEASGLEFDDFSGSYLPKHFKNLSEKRFNVNFDSKWQVDLENKSLYPKRIAHDIASIIDDIQPKIASTFNTTKQDVFQYKFLQALYKNITPLSVLNAIDKELQALKEEQNKMLISEFNSLISKEIKNQPTPFIYERLGEKYRHYFIDEFQDTSALQWENLIPLIHNTLSSENGSLMLVGDAKQAIYRWRGGKAEQFINLYNGSNTPFNSVPEVKNLPVNYRSHKEIVQFNNAFFKYLSGTIFNNEDYMGLYASAHQQQFKNEDGFVSINFLNIEKNDDRDEVYTKSVLDTLNKCLEEGFVLKDICVLVRKKKEASAIAEYLSAHGIRIMSSETMLIKNSPEVCFINNLIKLLVHPNNDDIKIQVLNYLIKLFKIEDKHAFLDTHVHLEIESLFETFKNFGVYVIPARLMQLPLYDLAETIVRNFNLVKTSDAYIQFYLDVVLEYSQKQFSSLSGFIAYFEKKEDTLNIVTPNGQDAVQVMTIHKSKGLEFPIVILPYADLDIYKEVEPREWYPLNPDVYKEFSYALLNYNKDFQYYGEAGKNISDRHQAELELDNINLLYVALTRPIQQLHIISKREVNAKGEANNKSFAGLFINYLKNVNLWNDALSSYTFGNSKKLALDFQESQTVGSEFQQFISTTKESHNINVVSNSGFLWDTRHNEAIEKGNLIHNIMSRIKTKSDLEFVFNDFIGSGMITNEQSKTLYEIVYGIIEHPVIKVYFNSDDDIYNEQEIISKDGTILRPDRLIVNSKNEVSIIDYKTGYKNANHEMQLIKYQNILEEMNYMVHKKILVYINDEIEIKEI